MDMDEIAQEENLGWQLLKECNSMTVKLCVKIEIRVVAVWWCERSGVVGQNLSRDFKSSIGI